MVNCDLDFFFKNVQSPDYGASRYNASKRNNGEGYHTFRRDDLKNQSVRSTFSANRGKKLLSAYATLAEKQKNGETWTSPHLDFELERGKRRKTQLS